MKVVIMAGGKGTRIAGINSDVPKPMISICGRPILERQINSLKEQGFTDITLVIGHLGHIIKDYFGNGERYGVDIDYIIESKPLGTAGALFLLKNNINDDFLLLNGDIIFDIDIKRFEAAHKEKKGIATLFTHPNSHPYDSGIIIADEDGKVSNWLHKEDKRLWYRNRVNAGIHMVSPKIFHTFTELKRMDLDRDVLKPLISNRELFVYDSPEYVKDMGTPDRYYSVIKDIESGLVHAKNLSCKQKAVFIDRDGTINKYVGLLRDLDEFELIDGVAEAIKKINQSGFLAIVVTNQPVVARGEVTLSELEEIHNKMETLLGEAAAYLDGIYYCPHHPHRGYEGERPEYKIECECRKPKPGMLKKAAEDFNIDLSQSWMVGDGENDIKAGIAAGCKTAMIANEGKEFGQMLTQKTLLEVINALLSVE